MSFMVGIATKNGIILAADSRGYFHDAADPKETPLAYFDRSFKVFAANDYSFGLATTGSGLINNLFVSAAIEDFIADYNFEQNTDPATVLRDLLREHIPRIPNVKVSVLDSLVFFSAGYKNGRPNLCSYSSRRQNPVSCAGYGLIASDEPDRRTVLPIDFESLEINQAAGLARSIIVDYARRGNRWQTIGGPIDMLLIQPGLTRWLSRKNLSLHIRTLTEFRELFKSGKLELNYLPPYGRRDLEQLIS